MDVCPETGSGQDPDLDLEVSDRQGRAIVRQRASACLTCQQAAYVDASLGS